jgi:hypothetical protein
MEEPDSLDPKDFPESMVTQALAFYLGPKGSEDANRMAWLFSLQAETPSGVCELSKLCGFEWAGGKISGGPEESFKENGFDRGVMSADAFKEFWTITPDFRYWTNNAERQLIIEAKGLPKPVGRRDLIQAQRYFSYFERSGHKGAIVYFAPSPENWLKWLIKDVAGKSAIPFGAVDLKDRIVPEIAGDLVRVVAKTLIQTSHLLDTALKSSKRRSHTS